MKYAVINVTTETRAKLYKISIMRTTETQEKTTMKDVVSYLADEYLKSHK